MGDRTRSEVIEFENQVVLCLKVLRVIFFTQLGDFGLAKWKTNNDPIYTRILGTFG